MGHDEQDKPGDIEGIQLTTGSLFKIGGLLLSIISLVVGAVLYVSRTEGKIALIERDLIVVRQERDAMRLVYDGKVVDLTASVANADKLSMARHTQQDVEIAKLEQRANNSDRTINDLSKKLDVAVAILERIEKKIP